MDYDSARHHYESLQTAKKKDEAKIAKVKAGGFRGTQGSRGGGNLVGRLRSETAKKVPPAHVRVPLALWRPLCPALVPFPGEEKWVWVSLERCCPVWYMEWNSVTGSEVEVT